MQWEGWSILTKRKQKWYIFPNVEQLNCKTWEGVFWAWTQRSGVNHDHQDNKRAREQEAEGGVRKAQEDSGLNKVRKPKTEIRNPKCPRKEQMIWFLTYRKQGRYQYRSQML